MVGWFRVGEEWRSVFPPGSADPMVGVVASCANLCVRLASSSRFDFGSRGGVLGFGGKDFGFRSISELDLNPKSFFVRRLASNAAVGGYMGSGARGGGSMLQSQNMNF